jgi:hypothetical protein
VPARHSNADTMLEMNNAFTLALYHTGGPGSKLPYVRVLCKGHIYAGLADGWFPETLFEQHHRLHLGTPSGAEPTEIDSRRY